VYVVMSSSEQVVTLLHLPIQGFQSVLGVLFAKTVQFFILAYFFV
jgi:hypothetical protein